MTEQAVRLAEWDAMIVSMQSEGEVVRTTNQFLATLPPSERERIPVEPIFTAEDIARNAIAVAKADRDSRRAGLPDQTLTTVAHVLTAAELRVRQLATPGFDLTH
jgi:hypothetical protein